MNIRVKEISDELFLRYPSLKATRSDLIYAYNLLHDCFTKGGKLLLCGNGGSAADCEHIVGELMKGFLLKRAVPADIAKKIQVSYPDDYITLCSGLQGALPAISLPGWISLNSAFSNDVAPDMVYAQQVYGLGRPGDTVLAISTSGNSRNVVNAVKIARVAGCFSVALTGEAESLLSALCDVTIKVPESETFKIQELHLPVYHALCSMLEAEFFSD